MPDLASWLLDCIAEDERVAREAVGTAAFQQQTGEWLFEYVPGEYGATPIVFAAADGGGRTQVANLETAWERDERGAHIARWDPARVLAECEAKRRLVDYAFENAHIIDGEWGDSCSVDEIRAGRCRDHGADAAWDVLRLLALPFADRPGYREEWSCR